MFWQIRLGQSVCSRRRFWVNYTTQPVWLYASSTHGQSVCAKNTCTHEWFYVQDPRTNCWQRTLCQSTRRMKFFAEQAVDTHLSAKEFTWRMQHGRKLMLKKGPQSAARINSWPSTPASFTQSPSEQFQQHTSVQVHHWGSQVSPTKQSKQSSSRALTSRSYQRSLPGTRWGLWGARCASAWHPCGPWRSARSGLLV